MPDLLAADLSHFWPTYSTSAHTRTHIRIGMHAYYRMRCSNTQVSDATQLNAAAASFTGLHPKKRRIHQTVLKKVSRLTLQPTFCPRNFDSLLQGWKHRKMRFLHRCSEGAPEIHLSVMAIGVNTPLLLLCSLAKLSTPAESRLPHRHWSHIVKINLEHSSTFPLPLPTSATAA